MAIDIGNITAASLYIGDVGALKACLGTEEVWSSTPPGPTPGPSYEEMPLTIEVTSPGTLMLKATNDSYVAKTIEYKLNDGEWTSMTTSTAGTEWNVVSGDTIQFKGDNAAYCFVRSGTYYYNSFSGSTAGFKVYGNILSLASSSAWTEVMTVGDYFVEAMFAGCTGLTDASNLVLPDFTVYAMYENFFSHAHSLTGAPKLPAMFLESYCYSYMFNDCTSLTDSPVLPALSASTSSYIGMFRGCSSLNHIVCLSTVGGGSAWSSWVSGVAETGIFEKLSTTTWANGVNGIPSGWTITDFVAPSATSISLKIDSAITGVGYALVTVTPYYAETSLSFTSSDNSIAEVDNYGRITAKGNGSIIITVTDSISQLSASASVECTAIADMKYLPLTFEVTDAGTAAAPALNFAVSGVSYNQPPSANGRSIYFVQKRNGKVYKQGYVTTTGQTYSSGATAATGFSKTIASGLTTGDTIELYGYNVGTGNAYGYGKVNSTAGAIGMQVYHYFVHTAGLNITVYGNVNSLLVDKADFDTYVQEQGEEVGKMQSYGAFAGLFTNRSGWTFNAPSATKHIVLPRPVDGVKSGAYANMFNGCKSMVVAPVLADDISATKACAGMFQGCTSLTTPPVLPWPSVATTQYYAMFYNCSALAYAPNLLGEQVLSYAYANMFNGCTSIQRPPVICATTLSSNAFQSMFQGCTSLTATPVISAAVLPASGCMSMFQGCTSLQSATILSEDITASASCRQMFQGCSNLTAITCMATAVTTSVQGTRLPTYNWVSGVAASGTFTKNQNYTWSLTGANGVPTNWTVVDAT